MGIPPNVKLLESQRRLISELQSATRRREIVQIGCDPARGESRTVIGVYFLHEESPVSLGEWSKIAALASPSTGPLDQLDP